MRKRSTSFCPPWILQKPMAQMGSLLEHWNTLLQVSLLQLRNCLTCLCARATYLVSGSNLWSCQFPSQKMIKALPTITDQFPFWVCSASYRKGMCIKYLLNIFAHTTPCQTHSRGSLQGNQLLQPYWRLLMNGSSDLRKGRRSVQYFLISKRPSTASHTGHW